MPIEYASVLFESLDFVEITRMAKSYSVTPVLRGGTSFYVATFKKSTGERVSRGLGTTNKDDADLICIGLVALRNRGIRSLAEKPIDVCEEAARLYFGEKKANETEVKASTISETMDLGTSPKCKRCYYDRRQDSNYSDRNRS